MYLQLLYPLNELTPLATAALFLISVYLNYSVYFPSLLLEPICVVEAEVSLIGSIWFSLLFFYNYSVSHLIGDINSFTFWYVLPWLHSLPLVVCTVVQASDRGQSGDV